jgi:hypothetical protein
MKSLAQWSNGVRLIDPSPTALTHADFLTSVEDFLQPSYQLDFRSPS